MENKTKEHNQKNAKVFKSLKRLYDTVKEESYYDDDLDHEEFNDEFEFNVEKVIKQKKKKFKVEEKKMVQCESDECDSYSENNEREKFDSKEEGSGKCCNCGKYFCIDCSHCLTGNCLECDEPLCNQCQEKETNDENMICKNC